MLRCWCEYTNESANGEILEERHIVVKYYDEMNEVCFGIHGEERGYEYVRNGGIIDDNVYDYYDSRKNLYYIASMGDEFVEVEKFNDLGNTFELVEKYIVLGCDELPETEQEFEAMQVDYEWKVR